MINDGDVYQTFQAACVQLSHLKDEKEQGHGGGFLDSFWPSILRELCHPPVYCCPHTHWHCGDLEGKDGGRRHAPDACNHYV